MKTKILMVVAIFLGSVAFAQSQIDKSAVKSGELVALNNADNDLYAYTSGYSVNEAGKVSCKVVTFYESGNLEESGSLLHGEKHGMWVKYNDQGEKLSEAKYNLGKKDGAWKVWDESGTLRVEVYYEDGNRVGTWKMYDSEGNVTSTKNY